MARNRDYGGAGELITQHWFQIGVTGVDLFFLISGYVMTHVAANLHARPGDLMRGFCSIAPPASIRSTGWSTIAAIILFAGKKFLFGEDTPLGNVLASFLAHAGREYAHPQCRLDADPRDVFLPCLRWILS